MGNSVIEHKKLEYKRELPSDAASDRRDFLKEVSSFANTSGGDIIFGIPENRNTGEPEAVNGLEIDNVDQEILRLEHMIRDNIEPRIPSVQTQNILLPNENIVLIIRIPKSYFGPHRVSYRGYNRFWARSTNGKYEMDVPELRQAFNLTGTLNDKIRNFVMDRTAKVYANETPMSLVETAKMVFHILPYMAFSPGQRMPVQEIFDNSDILDNLKLIFDVGTYRRINLEGLLVYHRNRQGEDVDSYVQLYKKGKIEAVDGILLSPDGEDNNQIPSTAVEERLIDRLNEYLSIMRVMGIEPPIVIFLTFTNIKGYSLAIPRRFGPQFDIHSIGRDIIYLPEIIIEEYNIQPETVLKSIFDAMWNACGFARSYNYNEEGEWIGNQR